MESEGSSAVLELKDDETGTDDGSIDNIGAQSHNIEDAMPLIMEHGYDIAVKVDAPMKQLSTLETFVTYRVRCVCGRWTTPPYVRRRYNHFKALHKRLSAAHPLLPVPPLPPLHSARQQLDRYSPGFVAVRTVALDAFLGRVAKHPILTHSEDLKLFCTLADDELDKTFKNESGVLSLWGLTTSFYNSGETKTSNGPRVKDLEFTSAADYLQSLQQKLTTLCSLTTKLYKDSAALGAELVNMERACGAWAAGEGRAACGGAARAGAARPRPRPPAARALLPFLAAYAAAVHAKIKERDALHAAFVAGNGADSLHNRLEQASEALRSDLTDWNAKTRAEIKKFLIDLADNQVRIHQQTLMAWEHAYKMSTETDARDIFKTVSKNAVQNLSPTKSRAEITPTETDRDLDDFDMENCSEGSAHASASQCHDDSSAIHRQASSRDCQDDSSAIHRQASSRDCQDDSSAIHRQASSRDCQDDSSAIHRQASSRDCQDDSSAIHRQASSRDCQDDSSAIHRQASSRDCQDDSSAIHRQASRRDCHDDSSAIHRQASWRDCHDDSSAIDKEVPRFDRQDDINVNGGVAIEGEVARSRAFIGDSSAVQRDTADRSDCQSDSCQNDISDGGEVKAYSDPLSEFAEIDLNKDL